jgi:hypothetical protein
VAKRRGFEMDKLIPIAMTLAFLAAGTGQLPREIKAVRIAQLQLIKDSQASKWGKAMLPPAIKTRPYTGY